MDSHAVDRCSALEEINLPEGLTFQPLTIHTLEGSTASGYARSN